jgi:hypothetical protein
MTMDVTSEIPGVESFVRGQWVQTSFGPGVVSAISYVDAILYVTLSAQPEPLYLLRPEQVLPLEDATNNS